MVAGFRQRKSKTVSIPIEHDDGSVGAEFKIRFIKPKKMAVLLRGIPSASDGEEQVVDPVESLESLERMAQPLIEAGVIEPRVVFGDGEAGADDVIWDELPFNAQQALVSAIMDFAGFAGQEDRQIGNFRSGK